MDTHKYPLGYYTKGSTHKPFHAILSNRSDTVGVLYVWFYVCMYVCMYV